jgi:signal transduction histidine kinase
MGDRIQLQQVLLNLIANAIDSMAVEDGPRVLSVSSEVHGGDEHSQRGGFSNRPPMSADFGEDMDR